ncbi:hypothetical protein KAR91_50840 [Candidatus Pacearchaeota archaeon]|nr:hypothetical protein [Candidatus Pacearchaeota archaeon]
MPTLRRFTASTPPPATTGTVRASDIGALTRSGEGAVARAITGAGRAAEDVISTKRQLDRERLYSEITSDVKTRDFEDTELIRQGRGRDGEVLNFQTSDEWNEYGDQLAKDRKNFLDERAGDAKDNRLRNSLKIYGQDSAPFYRDGIRKATSNEWAKNYLVSSKATMNAFVEAGQYGEAEAVVDRLFDGGLLTDAQAEAWRNDLASDVKADRVNAVTSGAFQAWQATVGEEDPDGDLDAAFDSINASDLSGDDKRDAEASVKARVTNRRTEAKLELEARQEEDLANINKLVYFDQDYAAADIAIATSSLSEANKTSLFADSSRRAAAVAKGIPIKNDRVEESRLYNKSLDIWRGTVSKKDFDDDLLKTAKSLDDEAYRRVSTSAANTLKSSQAEALSRWDSEAGRVLIDFRSEDAWATFMAESLRGKKQEIAKVFEDNANEDRQLQFFSLSRYNAELRTWIEENPTKVGKEFHQQAESLKHIYWDKSIDDIRAMKAAREDTFKTVRMVSPDGKVFEAPVGEKQVFLDNGYTEQ